VSGPTSTACLPSASSGMRPPAEPTDGGGSLMTRAEPTCPRRNVTMEAMKPRRAEVLTGMAKGPITTVLCVNGGLRSRARTHTQGKVGTMSIALSHRHDRHAEGHASVLQRVHVAAMQVLTNRRDSRARRRGSKLMRDMRADGSWSTLAPRKVVHLPR
jgi:hypothetical protein